MPTITLTITPEQLDQLTTTGTAQFTATLRQRKPKADAPLSPDDADKRQRVIDTWHSFRPEDHPGRVWKAVAKLTLSTDIILQALDTCLDWTSGRPYNPEWFVRDVAAWVERSQIVGLWQRETARDRYLATHK